jgi:hypothetical protein
MWTPARFSAIISRSLRVSAEFRSVQRSQRKCLTTYFLGTTIVSMGHSSIAKIVKATITKGDVKIILEGPPDFIEEQVAKWAGQPVASKNSDKNLKAVDVTERSSAETRSEREMIAEKQPRGHSEIIAVLGFCLGEAGQSEFGEEEIKRAYIRANVRPPKVVSQALIDAKRNHDFLEPVARGRYRLSSHGDRTVRFDLPRRNEA